MDHLQCCNITELYEIQKKLKKDCMQTIRHVDVNRDAALYLSKKTKTSPLLESGFSSGVIPGFKVYVQTVFLTFCESTGLIWLSAAGDSSLRFLVACISGCICDSILLFNTRYVTVCVHARANRGCDSVPECFLGACC